ncbi:BamA/TamA family outer membrane protein [bacterium]|nr:BamA/TamA family outer membrane protein [bacterium]
MKKKRWTRILLGNFLFILLIQLGIPCLAQTHIGPERTPPKRSTYKTALWPVRFTLKLPFQILRYTGQGLIIGIDESRIIPTYREIFFNDAETIGLYPMPSLSPSSGFGGGFVFFYDDFLNPGMDLEVTTELTTTSEHEAELSLKQPKWMNDRFYTNLLVKYDYDPDRDFYGRGSDSAKNLRSNFSLRTVNTEVDFGTNLTPTIQVGGNLGYLWADNGPSKSQNYPSIEKNLEEWFKKGDVPDDVPAFKETLSFLVPLLSLAHDNAMPAGQPHSGGREEFTVALYHELTNKNSRFIHYELQLSRYLHLFLDRTLAARVRMEMNSSMGEKHEVPFFLRSQLGGDDTLRGYSTGRFSDKDLVLATLEYRFPVWRHPSPIETHRVDGRIFMDAGRVFSDIFDEFTLRNMKYSVGFGLRFSSEEYFIFRLEIAKSPEQFSPMFKLKAVF